MDERLARMVIGNAVRASREVANLAPLLKDHADSEVREQLRLGVGSVVYEIHQQIIEPILAQFPALREEMERNLKDYGVLA